MSVKVEDVNARPAEATESPTTETQGAEAAAQEPSVIEAPAASPEVSAPAEPECADKPEAVGVETTLETVSTLGPVRAVILAVVLLIVVNTWTIALTLPLPTQGIRIRGLHHFYDVGQHLGAALIAAGLVAAWQKFGSKRFLWNRLALAAAALLISIPILRPDLHAFAHRVAPPRLAGLLHAFVTAVGALSVVVAAEIGRRLGERSKRWAWAGVIVGAIAFFINHHLLRRDYHGVHFYLAFSGAALVASSIASMPLPAWWPRMVKTLPWAITTLCAGFTLVVWPGNILLIEMLKVDGAVIAPWLARAYSSVGRGNATVPVEARAWFTDRSKVPPVSATRPSLLPPNPVIVFISVDALRADIIYSKRFDTKFPTLAKLRDQSIDFTMARANGSQTVYSLTTMFTGTYFSQQYWAIHPKIQATFPHEDPAPRFPKFLADAGINTVSVTTSYLFTSPYGLLGGFQEEISTYDLQGSNQDPYARGALLVNDIIARLQKQGPGPLFLYSHLLDAHAPYDRGGTQGSDFDRYLGEVGYVNREIGRLLQAIERTGLAPRTTFILTSDHGESFGEHGARTHGVNLYEELLRVPLFIKLPTLPPRKVNAPVTLVDLGPTILDLLGLPTPGYHMGQSLVPFLRGQNPTLQRPILAETRLKKSLVMEDGFKVIVDDLSHTTEVYNLNTDPRELQNLYDGPGSPDGSRVELLRLFFETHQIRKPGYVIPYRP